MANKQDVKQEIQQENKPAEKAEKPEPVANADTYSVDELIATSKQVFNAPQECVIAALKPLKKETMTVAQAKEEVKKFLKKEVK